MTLAFVLPIALVGCGTGANAPVKAPITVALSAAGPQTIDQGQQTAIIATLNNDVANKGVTWQLSGNGSLSDQTPTRVTYNAPATVPSSISVVVIATAVADTNSTARITITINPAPTVTTTDLPSASMGTPYSFTLQAGGGTGAYTWHIGSGSLPAWATLNSSTGSVSGTPNATGSWTLAVSVTDEAGLTSVTQTLTLLVNAPTSNAMLNGPYAFRLQGFDDATGNQFVVVGSFSADGKGNITGVEDVNGPGGYQPAVRFTGTYAIGPDRRGTAVFNDSAGQSSTFAIALGTLNDVNEARQATLIEFDDNSGTAGKRATGFVYYQDPYSLNLSSISGPYAFQFVGQSQQSGTRLVLTGAFAADGNGNLTSGEVYANTDGVMANEDFTATITADGTGSPERMVVTPTGTLLPPFVLYIVSRTDYGFTGWSPEALAMSTGPESNSGLFAGEILPQSSTAFSAASLNGTSVGYSVGTSSISAGLWTFDGSAAATFSFVWSDAQQFHLPPQNGNLTYSVSSKGRVTTQGASLGPGVPGVPIIYLVDKNKGFLMSTDSSASAGSIEPQTGGPFSNASLSGNFFLGTATPALTGWSLANGIGTSSASGTLDLTLDVSDPADLLTSSESLQRDIQIDGNGYGASLAPGWIPDFFFYMVSPDKVIFMQNVRGWPRIEIFER